ncbi:hypothetical protein Tco_0539969 [Tanacetum coccineum]
MTVYRCPLSRDLSSSLFTTSFHQSRCLTVDLSLKCNVMAAPVISISSDSSDESVRSVMPRVILFGTILTEIPVVPTDLPIAPEVTAAAVASPAGALETEIHSSSETGPSESPLPPVPVAPMVSPFLCSDVSKFELTAILAEKHISSVAHDVMVEIPTISPLPAPSALVTPAIDIISPIDAPSGFSRRSIILIRPGQAVPFGRPYRTYHNGPHSPLNSSSNSSSDHSLSDHSLPDHSLKDSIEEDIDAGVPANVGARTDVGVMQLGLDVVMQQLYDHTRNIPVDRIASIETGQRQLEVDSKIASAQRAGLGSRVAVLEKRNMRIRDTLRMESVRANRLRRRLVFVEDELRLIRKSRYYERMRFRRFKTFAARRMGFHP